MKTIKELEVSDIESGIDPLYGVGCDYLDDYEIVKNVKDKASHIWRKNENNKRI